MKIQQNHRYTVSLFPNFSTKEREDKRTWFSLFGGKRGKRRVGSRSKEFVLGFCGGGGEGRRVVGLTNKISILYCYLTKHLSCAKTLCNFGK